MSMRRFVAYFLAVSAGSTVAFASVLMAPPAPPEAATTEAMSMDAAERTAWMFQGMHDHPRHKPSARITQTVLMK